jgi:hypothetical protein
MEAGEPPPRSAALVLVAPDGTVVGKLPSFPVATPWWQDIAPVVAGAREYHRLDVTVLRLLEADLPGPPGGCVTYVAEVAAPVATEAWTDDLPDHPLRLPYARPGGPAADLAWARDVLAARGLALNAAPQQVRTWNLSSLWRLPLAGGDAWLKAVPPFFAHEGAMLELLEGEAVPSLLGRDEGRILLAAVPGEDLYEAGLPDLMRMVELLVGLQSKLIDRIGELAALGLPDWRAASLGAAIARVFERNRDSLDPDEAATLSGFIDELPARFAAVAACGIPDTLVHGDFHSGNVRGNGERLWLLDWGDSGVGHPLLDQAAFLQYVPGEAVQPLREHWHVQWRTLLPGADPARAGHLLGPVAAARQAVIYQNFLDGIEPAEHPYHRDDPANWLRATAGLLGSPRSG